MSRVETRGTALDERLDSALPSWATVTDAAFCRAPSATPVMANTADLGAMMRAATHHLRSLEPDSTTEELGVLTAQRRSSVDALKIASTARRSVSTLQPQSQEFGAMSLELFKVMRELIPQQRCP